MAVVASRTALRAFTLRSLASRARRGYPSGTGPYATSGAIVSRAHRRKAGSFVKHPHEGAVAAMALNDVPRGTTR